MDYDELRSVGSVSYTALAEAKGYVREGASLLDVAERLEAYMKDKGFGLAFPVNISINEVAAHYAPYAGDGRVFSPSDLVKIDLGARKGHSLGDCAITIDLSGRYAKLVEASEKCLEDAISLVRAGREVREIGRGIAETAKEYGFEPIRNLGGHGLSDTELHADVFIPNYDNGDSTVLEEGQVIAIEPFITTGQGYVEEDETAYIFQKNGAVSVRSDAARRLAAFIDLNYETFPFAERWLVSAFPEMSEFTIRKALREFEMSGVLESFPPLIEKKKGMVAQTEKEMIVGKDSCEIITK